MKANKVMQAVPLLTLLALTACGGGSSGGPSADPASSANDPTDEFGLGPTASSIQSDIDTIDIEQFAGSDGITFEFTQFYLHESMFPGFRMRVNNDSTRPIENVGCFVQALNDGVQVKSVSPSFTPTTIDPGESAIGSDFVSGPPSDFSAFDAIRVSLCTWNGIGAEFDLRRDITTGPVTVDFLGYSSSAGSPEARLLLTNNSANTITNARCSLDAKVGRTIVAVGSTAFGNFDDIAPGEAIEEGIVMFVNSLDSYDSTPFDVSNLNCAFTERN